ncbi:MAG: hypothetical protein RIC80_09215 [Cyclobacteriaceae bacterium]
MKRDSLMELILIGLLIICATPSQSQNDDLRSLIEQGRTAYEQDDFETSLRLFKQANDIRPNHPMITRLLVRLNSLTNRKKEAYESLENLRLIDADVEFLLHQDLQTLQGDKGFKKVQQAFDQMNSVEGTFDTVVVIANRKLHPESVVMLPNDGGLLLGSVHEKRIVKVAENGELEDWVVAGEHGLYAIMGMKVDEKRNLLWVASTAIPQMVWYSEELAGKAAVFAFDLASRALVKKYDPQDASAHWFGDLTLDENGAVYISDSQSPEIYRITSLEGTLEKWRSFPELLSLQGLTASGDKLFFADYIYGVHSVSLNDQAAEPARLMYPDGSSTKGTDGLYAVDDQLITIQNGVYPNRISAWTLSSDAMSLTSMRYLDKANPLFGEPTLGYIHDGWFYYIANSQWNGYQQDGTILKDDQLEDIYILKTSLRPQ